nr:hypothetical protein [Tanacetum cinerariifolium]
MAKLIGTVMNHNNDDRNRNDGKVNLGSSHTKSVDSFQNKGNAARKSFVEAIAQNLMKCDKALKSIPTEIDENGVEVVVFDDVMVAEGSKRWDLTLCAFFMGFRMSVNELRKPLVVRSVDLNLDNTELDRIPLWVKLCNVPLEAWIVKGISALASRLGKPLVMDSVIANKCKQGIGMVRYDRVLIEVNAKKILAIDVEIVYKNADGMVQCRKTVKKDKSGGQIDDSNEGFVEVKRKKNIGIDNKVKRRNFRANPQVSKVGNNSKTMYQAKTKEDVLDEIGGIAKCMEENEVKGTWNIRGISTSDKQDEIVKLIQKEKLQICVVFETHLKSKKIGAVHMVRQSVLVKVETIDGKLRLYGTFIYASSSGSSAMSSDMKIFQRCMTIIEVEDINSSGLLYSWTKNLHKTNNGAQTGILKKLDRVTGNEDFSNRFCQSYAMFLPYIIPHHCPSILVIPNDGYMMFKTIKNLKGLKKHLKKIAWCNGDVFENVKKLREAVKDVQKKIDKDPYNHDLGCEEANVLKLYSEAMKEEDKNPIPKSKSQVVECWDRNNAYFCKTIKSIQQRNIIDDVCDENGRRVEGNDVAE